MTTASPPRNPSDGISLEDMTRQVYSAIFTDSPSIRDNVTSLRTSINWIKWIGGGIGATVLVAAVKYIVFTPW